MGFPGETEEEFAASKAFVDKVNFYETHIFKYSKREGTKAAVMENQIPETVKTKRSAELIELGRIKQAEYEKSFLGKEVEVLVEERTREQGRSVLIGHTKEYLKVRLDTEEKLENQIVSIVLDERHLTT